MKCIRCGKEVPVDTKICDNCGYDFVEHKAYYKHYENNDDPDVPKEEKSSLIDNPLLTFFLGIISIIVSLIFLSEFGLVIAYLLIGIVLVYFTFKVSKKPCKRKLIPVRNIGRVFGYIASVILFLKVVYYIIGLLF